ncbi:hypothetical protein ACFTAO_10885 [Paenibacillus rhizoplanae]
MSIRLRLTAWYSGILAVMLLVLSAVIYGFVYINTYGDLKDRLQNLSQQVELKAGLTQDGTLQPMLGGDRRVRACLPKCTSMIWTG